jgi:hypothetical protein
MVNSNGGKVRAVISNLLRKLNGTQGKPRFAVGGSVALQLHGVRLDRPCKDLDIIPLSPIPSAAGLRRLLLEAGCQVQSSEREFPRLLRMGRVPFIFKDIECEILNQHNRVKTCPLQGDTPSKLLNWMSEKIHTLSDSPVLDLDVVVVWMALFGRDKDWTTIQALAGQAGRDDKPYIRDRDRIMQYVIDDRGSLSREVAFLRQVLWPRWYAY